MLLPQWISNLFLINLSSLAGSLSRVAHLALPRSLLLFFLVTASDKLEAANLSILRQGCRLVISLETKLDSLIFHSC